MDLLNSLEMLNVSVANASGRVPVLNTLEGKNYIQHRKVKKSVGQ